MLHSPQADTFFSVSKCLKGKQYNTQQSAACFQAGFLFFLGAPALLTCVHDFSHCHSSSVCSWPSFRKLQKCSSVFSLRRVIMSQLRLQGNLALGREVGGLGRCYGEAGRRASMVGRLVSKEQRKVCRGVYERLSVFGGL